MSLIETRLVWSTACLDADGKSKFHQIVDFMYGISFNEPIGMVSMIYDDSKRETIGEVFWDPLTLSNGRKTMGKAKHYTDKALDHTLRVAVAEMSSLLWLDVMDIFNATAPYFGRIDFDENKLIQYYPKIEDKVVIAEAKICTCPIVNLMRNDIGHNKDCPEKTR